jgi:glycosyltransferase involved in cell wall biosynthesis
VRLTHVISGLGIGGAETMLLKLIRASRARIAHTVIALRDWGPMGDLIAAEDVAVSAYGLSGPGSALAALPRFRATLKLSKPNLIQGWMYHGNLATSLGARLSGLNCPTAWSVRCTIGDFKDERSATRSMFLTTRLFADQPRAIIYNSVEAQREHEAAGYPASTGLVIPNGFDLASFTPDPAVRQSQRRQLGFRESDVVFGLVARLHPMKDPGNFLAAAAVVAREHTHARFVIAGRDMPRVAEEIESTRTFLAALGSRLTVLPELSNVVSLLNALDVFALTSSYGEGFPNALGEAMTMSLPAIVTAVGDGATVLGDCGIVVRPRQVTETADAMRRMLAMGEDHRRALGQKARARINDLYSIQAVAARYEATWATLARKA